MSLITLLLISLRLISVIADRSVIELAVFIDFYQWQKAVERFTEPQAEPFIKKFVQAVVSNTQILFHHHTMNHPLRVKIVKLDIWRTNPAEMCDKCIDKQGPNGSAQAMLDVFTEMIQKQSVKWDAAVLFTGLDTGKVQGIAHLGTMCSHSAVTVVTGTFGAGSVLPHELGHLLSMTHDKGSAMDPGLTRQDDWYWSDNSNDEMHEFLTTLNETKRNCLVKNSYRRIMNLTKTPALLFSADEQCHWNHDILTNIRQPAIGICSRIQCTRVLWLVILTTTNSYSVNQLALEGTQCGQHGQCHYGRCNLP